MLSDSDSETNIRITINEHYAKAYAYKKEREELGRLKDKYGSDPEESIEDDSEDDESEDEDGEELTPAMDAAILRTLARIKRKDPDIYNNEKGIFEQEHRRSGQSAHRSKTATKDHTKPLTIKQHAISSMLKDGSRSPSPEPPRVTHTQEQNALRSEAISTFHNALDDDEDEDKLLVLREKTQDEIDREEEEYKTYLEREVGENIRELVDVEDGERDSHLVEEIIPVKSKKRKKGKRDERDGEKKEETAQEFLMNYLLNRGWIDRSSKRLPTYKDITHAIPEKSSEGQKNHESDREEAAQLTEDDEFDEIVDRFESSYNFRFEEPDAAVIPKHPRNLESAVRRQNTARKEARERRHQRKEGEMLKKKEEVKRLKALKMKEIRQKLDRISKEGGIDIDSQVLAELDLEGDWDPEKHDRQLSSIYAQDEQEDEKPQWDDDIDITDIVGGSNPVGASDPKSQKKKKKKKKGDGITEDGVDVHEMDADAPVEQEDEEWDGTEEMRKRKVQEYMDEVYGMEFNDMVGGMPTRFKYASVTPHSYALNPAETLLATDAQLNEYMGIKKFAPYRKDSKWDNRRAGRLRELKAKLKDSRWDTGDTVNEGEEHRQGKKRKGKKERQREKAEGENVAKDEAVDGVHDESPPKKKRRA